MGIDYSKYPPDWKEIRARILERADNRCEGSPAYPDCRVKNYSESTITGSKIVLTIAHLDHDSDNWNVKDDRLRAWCQRCHLKYDLPMHIYKRKYGKDKNQLKINL